MFDIVSHSYRSADRSLREHSVCQNLWLAYSCPFRSNAGKRITRTGPQTLMNQNMRSNSGRGRSRPIKVRHALRLLVLTGVLAASGLATAVWWQDRPLRQAAAYLEEGDLDKALSTIDAFLRDHPSDGKAMSLRACTLVAVGRPAQAIDLFERFGGSSPKELHAWA